MGKRAALKLARDHSSSVKEMQSPRTGHKEAKRRFIVAGLRHMRAPAVFGTDQLRANFMDPKIISCPFCFKGSYPK